MLTAKDYRKMTIMNMPCPYGRDITVGSMQCTNCKFHHIEMGICTGEIATVAEHVRHMKAIGQ